MQSILNQLTPSNLQSLLAFRDDRTITGNNIEVNVNTITTVDAIIDAVISEAQKQRPDLLGQLEPGRYDNVVSVDFSQGGIFG